MSRGYGRHIVEVTETEVMKMPPSNLGKRRGEAVPQTPEILFLQAHAGEIFGHPGRPLLFKPRFLNAEDRGSTSKRIENVAADNQDRHTKFQMRVADAFWFSMEIFRESAV
jgi:hypothetical protein